MWKSRAQKISKLESNMGDKINFRLKVVVLFHLSLKQKSQMFFFNFVFHARVHVAYD